MLEPISAGEFIYSEAGVEAVELVGHSAQGVSVYSMQPVV